ncbi:MAG: beta-galactosidase trimerization domain-containing protein, partial [Planctomycetia bacterium]|nr:beta-galactosidase trimerization domain-containing protein [Planctomycetia bacterium]
EYGYNLVNLDGTATDRLEMAGKIAACLKEHEELFDALQPEAAKVAIAFSTDNSLMNFFNEMHARDYWQSYTGLSRALAQAGCAMDIVRADAAVDDDYSKYDVIYLPMPNYLNGTVAKKLAAFVRRGGTLVSEPSLAQYADDFYSSSVVPGMGMDKVFGCVREDIRTLKEVPLKWKSLQLNGTFYREYLTPRGARVRAKFSNGKVAATENAYGRGRAIYFGTNVFKAYYDKADANLIKVVQEINRPVKRDVWSDSANTIVRVASACGKRAIFVFNAVNETTRASLQIKGSVKSLTDIFGGGAASFRSARGTSSSQMVLGPYQTRILVG